MRSPALSPDKGSGVCCQKVVYIDMLRCENLKFLGTSFKIAEYRSSKLHGIDVIIYIISILSMPIFSRVAHQSRGSLRPAWPGRPDCEWSYQDRPSTAEKRRTSRWHSDPMANFGISRRRQQNLRSERQYSLPYRAGKGAPLCWRCWLLGGSLFCSGSIMFGEVAKGILRNIWDMLVANGCILCTAMSL